MDRDALVHPYQTVQRLEDRFGHAGVSSQAGAGFDPSTFAGFEDIFGGIFGDFFGGGRRGGPERGSDLRYDLEIEFLEAALGTEKEIRVPRLEACGACRGSGSKGGERVTCRRCGGRGQVVYQRGFFALSQPCTDCGGTGHLVKDPCPACGGEGRRKEVRHIKVRIPPGIDTGMRLRVGGEGEGGARGGRTGDLYVVVRVKEHPLFKRDGQNLIVEVPLTISQAVLGTRVEVPTLEGREAIVVPPGTQHGATFRLRGKGIANPNGGARGDLYVATSLQVPRRLSRKLRELYEKLREVEEPAENAPKDLFERVKDIFN